MTSTTATTTRRVHLIERVVWRKPGRHADLSRIATLRGWVRDDVAKAFGQRYVGRHAAVTA